MAALITPADLFDRFIGGEDSVRELAGGGDGADTVIQRAIADADSKARATMRDPEFPAGAPLYVQSAVIDHVIFIIENRAGNSNVDPAVFLAYQEAIRTYKQVAAGRLRSEPEAKPPPSGGVESAGGFQPATNADFERMLL